MQEMESLVRNVSTPGNPYFCVSVVCKGYCHHISITHASPLALFTALDFLVQLLHHEDEVIIGNTALCLSHCVDMSK